MTTDSIIVGEGLTKLKFGMTKSEVHEILGEPTNIEKEGLEDVADEELNEAWHYDEKDLSVLFDAEEGFRLIALSVTSNAYTFNGKELVGLSQKDLEAAIEPFQLGALELESFDLLEEDDHQLLSIDDASLNFWFEKDVLAEIQWGPVFEDDDTIKWPAL